MLFAVTPKRILWILTAALFVLSLAPSVSAVSSGGASVLEQIPDPVAVVNGQPISREEFLERLLQYHGVYVLENLIGETLLESEAEQRSVSVSEQEVDKRVQERREEAKVTSPESFRSLLLKTEYTENRYRDEARLAVLAEKAFADKAVVTNQEVEEYYNRNKTSFTIPATAKIRLMVLRTEQLAQRAVDLLKEGQTFGQVTEALGRGVIRSTDEAVTIPLEGIAPWFRVEVEKAPLGKPHGPIKVPGDPRDENSPAMSYQVIEVISRDRERLRTFDEVKDEIREALFNERMYGTYGVWNLWLSKERSEADVRRFIEFQGEPVPRETAGEMGAQDTAQ